MNFNVGNAQKSTTQASGLSFGSAAGSGGGFGFNANAASTGTTASTGGFSFGGTVQTSAAKGLFGGSSTSTGGLAFGTGATSTAFGGATPLSTPGGGFSFGQPTTDGTTGAKPNSGALAFGMQSPAQSSFGLGATAQPTVQSPFGMGATTQPSFGMGAATQAQSQPSFGMGAATQAQSQPSFGVGAATQAQSQPSFGVGTAAQVQSQPSFGMGAATQAQSQPSFGMGAATQAQSQPSFGLGTNPQSTTSSFGFGAKTQASFGLGAAQTTKPAFSFATPAPTQSGGLSFGNPVSTTVAASTTTSGFGFGLATPGFGLSTISQQPTQGSLGLSAGAGAQITSKPSSLGFGNSIIPKTLFGAAPIQSAPASNPPSFETRLGTSQAAQKPGFNLTASTLASTQVPATTNSGLQLGTKTTASTTIGTGFKLTGQTTTAAPPAFGLSAVSTAATLQPSSGMFSMNKITFSTSTTTVSNTTAAATPSTTPSTTFLTQSSSSTTVTTSTTKPTLLSAFKVPSMNIATSSTAVAATASTTTAASSTPSMTYKELEKKINKWGGELEHQERLFLQQATQVNAWNKLLIENSEKISSLNSDFERVKYDQERLDQELDFIKTQQEDLEEILLPLENSTRQKVTSLSMHTTHPADLERERTYNLADNIDGQLKRMVQDLREVIDHVNTTSTPADTANPVDQISKILSAHMDSLQWLDSNSGALQQKLDQLTKQVNDRKLEQENRYRLAFD